MILPKMTDEETRVIRMAVSKSAVKCVETIITYVVARTTTAVNAMQATKPTTIRKSWRKALLDPMSEHEVSAQAEAEHRLAYEAFCEKVKDWKPPSACGGLHFDELARRWISVAGGRRGGQSPGTSREMTGDGANVRADGGIVGEEVSERK
jgi:hypothetical protein